MVRNALMRWFTSTLSLPALALFLVQAFAAEVETAKGPATVGKTPQTLAVFDIAAVDTLSSLGVKIAGLPDNLYVPELAGLRSGAEVVGTIFEPDLSCPLLHPTMGVHKIAILLLGNVRKPRHRREFDCR